MPESLPPAFLAVPVDVTDHVAGPEHAPVTVVEYGDYECPVCAGAEPAVRQLRARFASRLRFVFRHFPLEDEHPRALVAAEAAEAAAAQGRFWPMHGLLMSHSPRFARGDLDRYAALAGLEFARFRAELDDEVYRQRVREHQAGGRASHVRGTPTFFVNGSELDLGGGIRVLLDTVAGLVAGHGGATR